MKMRTETVRGVPNWAIGYLVNSDASGISNDEKEMVDAWVARMYEQGLRIICPKDGTENAFNSWPAFGLPCDTTDFIAEIIPKKGIKK